MSYLSSPKRSSRHDTDTHQSKQSSSSRRSTSTYEKSEEKQQQQQQEQQMKSNLSDCSSVSPATSNSCLASPKSNQCSQSAANNTTNSSNDTSNHASNRTSSHSPSSFSYSSNLRTKCTKCALWQNLYKIFEFLTTGRLNKLGLDLLMRLGSGQQAGSSMLIERLESLASLVSATKAIINPIDPCDDPSWSWDYKCPKHYKLLKLKLKLINQSEQLIKLATCPVANGLVGAAQSERSCALCAKLLYPNAHFSKYLSVNESLAARLAMYVTATRPVLERVFDKFVACRLKNSYEITNQSDFYVFLREPFTGSSSSGGRGGSSSSSHDYHQQQSVLNAIEYCANKIYNLLDLLVYDNLKVSIDRPIKEFNAMLNITSTSSSSTSNTTNNNNASVSGLNRSGSSLQARRDSQQGQSSKESRVEYHGPSGSICGSKANEIDHNNNTNGLVFFLSSQIISYFVFPSHFKHIKTMLKVKLS
jgi:hypothetical protein